MGNISSSSSATRRRHSRRSHHPPPPPPPPEIAGNRYVFAAATPYPNPAAPHYYPFPAPGYYQGPVMPLPAPYDHHHRVEQWVGGRYPCGPVAREPMPYVDHQKAETIRNEVNLRKESLRIEVDVDNPGNGLVCFTFDATVAGSITVIFFAKEGDNCNFTPTKEEILPPLTVKFDQGLGQKFRQPSGTGINFSMFEEKELTKDGEIDVYPLAVKAEASPANHTESDETKLSGSTNSQITQAMFEKEKGEYHVKGVKQILYVNEKRYELQEIYGIGNSVDAVDANDTGKECVICLSEPRDTTVLPCRHMCMCSGCAKVLRFQTTRCPICRQLVERLLEIKVNNASED